MTPDELAWALAKAPADVLTRAVQMLDRRTRSSMVRAATKLPPEERSAIARESGKKGGAEAMRRKRYDGKLHDFQREMARRRWAKVCDKA